MTSISTKRRKKITHRKRIIHKFLTMPLSSNPVGSDYYNAKVKK